MNWWITIPLALASFETARAQSKIVRTISVRVPPEDMVEGPLVSAVIPAYNEERYLPGVLTALGNQTYSPIEIIVVDNDSDDDTVQIARDYGAMVLSNPVLANINMSRNIGFDAAAGDYLAFFDADVIPESQAVEKMVEALMNGTDIVYPNRCSTDHQLYSSIRVVGGWLDPGGLAVGSGALGTRRDVMEAIGGWDENINPLAKESPEHGKNFIAVGNAAGFHTSQLKATYVGVSDRRHIAGDLSGHWLTRAVRGDESDRMFTGGAL